MLQLARANKIYADPLVWAYKASKKFIGVNVQITKYSFA